MPLWAHKAVRESSFFCVLNLLLPVSGHRDDPDGQLYSQASIGFYWSPLTVNSTTYALRLNFSMDGANPNVTNGNVGDAFSLRCIKI